MKKIRHLSRILAISILLVILLFLMYALSREHGDFFTIDRSLLRLGIIQRGDMLRDVRGPGILVAVRKSSKLMATLQIVVSSVPDIALNQKVLIDTQNGILSGRVIRIADTVENGTRGIDVALDNPSLTGVSRRTPVIGTIQLETLRDIVYMDRPALAEPNTVRAIFKLIDDGKEIIRIPVRFGRASTNAIEVLDGLKVGDKVVLSDMTNYDNVDQIQVRLPGK